MLDVAHGHVDVEILSWNSEV